MLNSFQHPFILGTISQFEQWALKQVGGDSWFRVGFVH